MRRAGRGEKGRRRKGEIPGTFLVVIARSLEIDESDVAISVNEQFL